MNINDDEDYKRIILGYDRKYIFREGNYKSFEGHIVSKDKQGIHKNDLGASIGNISSFDNMQAEYIRTEITRDEDFGDFEFVYFQAFLNNKPITFVIEFERHKDSALADILSEVN